MAAPHYGLAKRSQHSAGENLYNKIFEDRVYVFTPNGDVFDLEAGATPLDFAYHVHSDIGHRCRGAKVNDMMVPLTYHFKPAIKSALSLVKKVNPAVIGSILRRII